MSRSSSSTIESSSTNTQPTIRKKRRINSETKGGASRSLPPHIQVSQKGTNTLIADYVTATLALSCRGFIDTSRHVNAAGHLQRLKDTRSLATITLAFASVEANATLAKKVILAEIMMSQFIAIHNLSFHTAEHLSDIVFSMFPDSI